MGAASRQFGKEPYLHSDSSFMMYESGPGLFPTLSAIITPVELEAEVM